MDEIKFNTTITYDPYWNEIYIHAPNGFKEFMKNKDNLNVDIIMRVS